MFTLMIMTASAALPMNMFLSSLPNMAKDFGVPYPSMSLAITIYLAFTAIVQLIIGPLSDLYGRRPVILSTLAISVVATLGAALAESYTGFMIYRCIQAAAVTGTVLSRAIVRDVVAREDAASKIGYVTMGMAVVPMLSIPLGGVLEETFGWRSVFYFITAVNFLTWALNLLDSGETLRHRASSFSEHFHSYPTLLASVRFWCYVAILTLTVSMYFIVISTSPNIGTKTYGFSPTTLGIYLSIMPIGYFVGNFISGRYSKQFGIQPMIMAGGLFLIGSFALSLFLVILIPTTPIFFFISVFVMGIGNGVVIPNTTAALLEVNPDLAGSASGLSGSTMTLFGAVISSLAGFIVSGTHQAVLLLALLCVIAVLQLLFTIWVGRIEMRRRTQTS